MTQHKSPTIGRTVMFVPEQKNGDTILPGIVVEVQEGYSVNLQVFANSHLGVMWKTNVKYDMDGKPGTWHWPEIK